MKEWIGYKKGINLGGWFSQCDHSEETYDTFITEDDFKVFSKWGIDHVRLPIDYQLLEDDMGTHKPEGFKRLHDAVNLCGKYGLNVIIDMHRVFGYSFFEGYGEFGFFDEPALQERYYKLWEAVASEFGHMAPKVSFELLNEITEQSYSEKWNRIARVCMGRIRKIAPDVDIVVGSYWNNSFLSLPDLNIKVDEHTIFTFHCYEPLIYTHQGADWISTMSTDFRYSIKGKTYEQINADFAKVFKDWYASRILVPGGTDNPNFGSEYFTSSFASAVECAEKQGVALYCGEYGCIQYCDPYDQLFWFKAIHETFVELGIGRAAWTYKKYHFGISDARLDGVRDELIKNL